MPSPNQIPPALRQFSPTAIDFLLFWSGSSNRSPQGAASYRNTPDVSLQPRSARPISYPDTASVMTFSKASLVAGRLPAWSTAIVTVRAWDMDTGVD